MILTHARPIWLRGLHRERNIQAGFRYDLRLKRLPATASLRVTGSSLYRAYVNGRFVGHGPAKPPLGYARVDELPVAEFLVKGTNAIAIEVAGYNDINFYTIGDPSFVLAEVVVDGKTIAATGKDWRAIRRPRRQRVEHHGYQRAFSELWDLNKTTATWTMRPGRGLRFEAPEVLEKFSRKLLPRGVPLPTFAVAGPAQVVSVGIMHPAPDRPITPLRNRAGMYADAEIDEKPSLECARERPGPFRGNIAGLRDFLRGEPIKVAGATGATTLFFETGELRSCFAGLEINLPGPATIDLIAVEKMSDDGDLDPRRDACVQVTRLHAPAGRTRFESFEPASTRYLRLIVRGVRNFTLHAITFRDYAYPALTGGSFLCSDGELNRIYDAARTTLRLNTLDEFYDCPSRERAGWLCDSFFSARAAFHLWGDTVADRVMLEDYLLADAFPGLPEGMIPECYPAGMLGYIPNWALFFILQLGEHLERTGDARFIAQFRPRVEGIIAAFDKFLNPEGLLESLGGWVFVDWSIANETDYVQPVSTACNALYALTLGVAGKLFGRADWAKRAGGIRSVLRRVARRADGTGLFSDSLVRGAGGKLQPSGKISEACQYYAFWTGLVQREEAPGLTTTLLEEFGPAPERYPSWMHVGRANVFLGQYLRFELLARWGLKDRLLKEMKVLFPAMIDAGPGTLWENLSPHASVCHAFSAHAAVWLKRDFLGLAEINVREKRIRLAPHPANLKWAAGTIELPDGLVSVNWSVDPQRFRLVASVPKGYVVDLLLPAAARQASRITVGGRAVRPHVGHLLGALPSHFELLAECAARQTTTSRRLR